MLDGFKRLFAGPARPATPWDGVAAWAEARQFAFRAVQQEGFVVDGHLGSQTWRLEWGPSQRPYIHGQELRLRAELGLGSALQMLLLNRELQEQMERDIFEQYVEGVQTRIDDQTPPEMRWLVMFPRLPGATLGGLRERYVALGSVKAWLQRWLQGPLLQALGALRREADTPMVLMIGRGRLTLRTALPDADEVLIQSWLRLFEVALREAQRTRDEAPDQPPSQARASSLWSASDLIEDDDDPGSLPRSRSSDPPPD